MKITNTTVELLQLTFFKYQKLVSSSKDLFDENIEEGHFFIIRNSIIALN